MTNLLRLSGLSAGLLLAASTQAATIGLSNTGVDALGVPLANGTTPDLHYSLVSAPAGAATSTRVLTSADGYPVGPWLGDTVTSAWIGPNTADANGPVGNYTYRTTFDLTGLDPLTATITGRWSTDNNGIAILLNGANTGNPGTSFTQFSEGYVSFSIASGFVAGVNTLDFQVYNGGGPTGLRVEMSGTAAVVPEPTTVVAGALLLLPFGVSLVRTARKQRGQ